MTTAHLNTQSDGCIAQYNPEIPGNTSSRDKCIQSGTETQLV